MDNVDFQRQTTSEEDIIEDGIAEVAPDLYEIHLLSIAWPYQGIVAQHRRGPATQRGFLDQVLTIQGLKTTPQLGENRGQPIFHDAPTPSRRAAAGTACVIYLTPLAPNIKAYANT